MSSPAQRSIDDFQAGMLAPNAPTVHWEEVVKKLAIVAATLCFVSLSVWAAPNSQSVSGWISDSKCAAKGANEGHAACAKKCVEAGEKPVLVTDKDQKVVPIENPGAVAAQIGQHVQINGTMTASGALHVDKVQAQGQ